MRRESVETVVPISLLEDEVNVIPDATEEEVKAIRDATEEEKSVAPLQDN